MRIYLVGFMGCGKTTVGRALAASLGVRFVDLDAWVEEALGARIPEIFTRRGEAVFRAEERRQLRVTTGLERVVVATGGGTFCVPDNREVIRAAGGVAVFLDVPPEVLLARLPGKNVDRPKFGDPDQARGLYKLRRPQYLKADVVLSLAGDEPPEAVVRQVMRRLGERSCVT